MNIFWVPVEARWARLKANARQPTIGQIVDDAMTAIEANNPSLKGVLPRDYARVGLDKTRLGQLIDMVTDIGLGDKASRSKDVLGRVYESGEGEIRKNMVEADLVGCMVALPGQLFYSTQIPVCLWFLAREKGNGKFRDRRGEVLFIDARKMGAMTDRTHRELTDADLQKIAGTYPAWRGDKEAGAYADVAGFCKAAALEEIRKHGLC